MNRTQAIETLAEYGIKTIAELDAWRKAHPQPGRNGYGPFIDSRFGTLKALIGENHAINIIEALAARQCI